MKKKITFYALLFLCTLNFSAQNWNEILKATASDAARDHQYGANVDIDGDYAVVAANYANGNSSGAVYVLRKNGNSWIEEQKIVTSDLGLDDRFASSVAISGTTIVIAANRDDEIAEDSGAVYVFTKVGNSWVQQAKLKATDASRTDTFGSSIDIFGDLIIIGAPHNDQSGAEAGSAYIFERNGTTWTQQIKLFASDASAIDLFGSSVSINNNICAISSIYDDDNGSNSGSVYIFENDGNGWQELEKITASDGVTNDNFGRIVTLCDDRLFVGVPDKNNNTGVVYVFNESVNGWGNETKIEALDLEEGNLFGFDVDFENDIAIISSSGFNNISGAVYVFELNGNNWAQEAKIIPSDFAVQQQFGRSAAISNETIIVGALYDTENGSSSGASYFFDRNLNANSLPIASNVLFTGALKEGEDLYGQYAFSDLDNHVEGSTTYQWYESDDNAGTNKIAIANAINQTYTLTTDDIGKFISFEVTPNDGTDYGIPVESALQGPIQIANTPPTIENVIINGTLETNIQVVASYDYSDIDSDLEEGTTYQWYVSDDANGTNKAPVLVEGNQIKYRIFSWDINKYLSLEVTPKDGVSFGTPVESNYYGPILEQNVTTMPGNWDSIDDSNPLLNGYKSSQSIALDANNVPYIVLSDPDNDYKITVLKLENNTWTEVGVQNFKGWNYYVDALTFDKNNALYLTYRDIIENRVTVKKFDGIQWESVGGDFITTHQSHSPSLKFDNNNVPYVSYSTNENGVVFLKVQKLEGNSWINVGNLSQTTQNVTDYSFAMDHTNNPIITYGDEDNYYRVAIVRRFDGSNWVQLGNTINHNVPSYGGLARFSLAISLNNQPILAITDPIVGARVIQFDGAKWDSIGEVGSINLYPNAFYGPHLTRDNKNNLYLLYKTNNSSIEVKMFDGEKWIFIGNPPLSSQNPGDMRIIADKNNKLYIIYGESEPTAHTQVKVFNISHPSVSNVSFSGTLEEGEELTASYTYADSDNDLENGSIYQWYASDDNLGTNKAAIANAVNQTYTLTTDDVGKYISFEVAPNDGYSFGVSVESDLQGPIQMIYLNNFPTAQDDELTVTENSVNNIIQILEDNGSGADDYGSDGPNADHPIAISGTHTDAGSEIELVGNTVVYTPRPGYSGADGFSYTITDASGDSSTATVSITVIEVATPTAVDDIVADVPQDSATREIDVLENDNFGTDGAAATGSLTVDALGLSTEGGTIEVNAQNNIDYTPGPGYFGPDSFSYTITDADGDQDTAVVTINVTKKAVINGVPLAKADAITVTQNSTDNALNVFVDNGSGADDFGDDGAADGGLTMISGATSGVTEQGTIVFNDKNTDSPLDDTITYTPNPGYTGLDHFYYMITDVSGDTAIAQVTITVAESDTPTALADPVSVGQDSGVNTLDVLANDSFGSDGQATANALVIDVVNYTGGATLAVNAGKVEYTPATGFDGVDTFNYTITDGSGDTSTATVTVTVSGVVASAVPVAQDDAVTVTENTEDNVINILDDNGNGVDDYGTEGASLTHPISGVPLYTDLGGKLVLVGNTVLYTPKTDFSGVDSFSYTITDTKGIADAATVTITVVGIPVALAATDDEFDVVEGSTLNELDVLDNDDYGSNGAAATDALVIDATTNLNGATIDVVAGKVIYTPDAGFSGDDTFEYVITDANSATSRATVTVSVGAVVATTAPVAQDDAVSVVQDSQENVINILDDNGNGVDSYGTEGPNLTHPISGVPGFTDLGGELQLVGNTVLYTPRAGFVGEDSFSYKITDTKGIADDATVTITVTTAPDVLTATNDDFAVDQDSNDNTLDVLDNDVLVNVTAITLDTNATLGAVSINDAGSPLDYTDDFIEYTPLAGSTAEDTFMYTLLDGTTTSTATVTVTIGATPPTNDTPTAQDDAVTVLRNSENNVINILDDNGNGADSYGLDGPNANHPIAGIPAYTDLGGKLELVGNTVLYTPETAFVGTDRFSYTITDENGDADTAEVTITVALSKTEDTTSFQRDLQVYPNPSKGDVQVTLYSAKAQEASVVLFDVTGKVVYQQQQTLAVGNNTLQFQVKVKAGIMLLKVYSSNTNFGTRKVVFE